MKRLTEQVLAHAEKLPEGTPISAKGLLHLGTRAGVDQALSRLTKRGQLLRAGRGIYFCPVKCRFGIQAPSVGLAIRALGEQRGETIVQHGAAAANALGLITQVPVRAIYLTSGRSRTLMFDQQKVELRHAPSWQLVLANHPVGQVVRALVWLGPEHTEKAIKKLKRRLPSKAFDEMAAVAHQLPDWLAEKITRAVADV
ncbi:MAG: type IV toxin-antitoxin system AbiEi family antitoxin domain-containing protein [Gammaproteobacteria bacterium AqS3]|nr:type IV toxin-antitoxin system AbiEi family antitoxin domain-containing protein [Gammaproteobacteria bacterium AqS3]